ncbi:MAG TPA: DUF465 domain-containing protein [Geminicoccaceae bacterium]|jgi:hypothetical protein|nr:DUF465 domain-containing protein [Geminicoccaceae bacterium]
MASRLGQVEMTDSLQWPEIERKLAELRAAHRALDERIAELIRDGYRNQLELQRLKKQKLALRDRIVRLESDRLPDIIA